MQFFKSFIHPFSKLLFNGKYLFIASIIEKASYFFAFVLIARQFSQQSYGEISTAFAFGNILFSFFEFGFAFYFQRDFASPKSTTLNDFTVAYNFRLLLWPLFLLLASVYFAVQKIDFVSGLIIAVSVYILGYNNLFSGVLFGTARFKEFLIALFWGRLTLLISVVLLNFSHSIVVVSLSFLFSAIVQYFLSNSFLGSQEINVPQKIWPSVNKLRQVFRSSIPMATGMIMVWANDRMDIVLLNGLAGSEVVAVYAVAYSVYKLPQAFSNIILTPLFTDASKAYAEQGLVKFQQVRHSFAMLIIYIIITSALLFFLSGPLIVFVYGSSYTASVTLSQTLSLALPWLLLNNFTGTMLNSVGLEKQVAFSIVPSLLLSILINIFFIPQIGVIAAVIATIIAELSIFLFQLFLLLKSKRIRFSL